ncbi:uncharacterized protein LOC126907613 [Daktulosphaira vitifoliae]|uniref:uncharacterized protein LOC126907613 n=1 Tax=Daktulosphaira vitifoliae TaxID=58002 RepID=UPI0021AA6A26|nr:uncharacterized protein LOC126907613 [Daktulosphaira vitifoliae]
MFTSMFNSLSYTIPKCTMIDKVPQEEIENKRNYVESLLDDLILTTEDYGIEGHFTKIESDTLNDYISSDSISDSSTFYDYNDTVDSVAEHNKKSALNENICRSKLQDHLMNDFNTKKTVKINSLQCLFSWKLNRNTAHNIMKCIIDKYDNQTLNLSIPEFTFEKFIGNIIICFELFQNNDCEMAQIKMIELYKWIEIQDNRGEEFYLSIQIGLKHIVLSTFAQILITTNCVKEYQWLLDEIIPFENIEFKSKAAIYAVHAAVLVEYGEKICDFKKAKKYAKEACNLDSTNAQWQYVYSQVLAAHRYFLFKDQLFSNPTKNEICLVQNAVILSKENEEKINFHKFTLEWDIIINNFYRTVDKKSAAKNKELNEIIYEVIQAICKKEVNNSYFINWCKRTLMTVPIMVDNVILGKKLLKNALKMAPNNLVLLNAVEIATDFFNENDKLNNFFMNIAPEKENSLSNELQLIVDQHNIGKDAIPLLISLLKNVDGFDLWIILAQICSYNIIYKKNLRVGVDNFMMLIENKPIDTNDLIVHHYSIFMSNKKINLAELINNEIRLTIKNNSVTFNDMLYYLKVLSKILEVFKIKTIDVDPFMCSNLICNTFYDWTSNISEYHKNDNIFKHDVANQNVEKKLKKRKSRSKKHKYIVNVRTKIVTKKLKLNKNKKLDHPSNSKNIDLRFVKKKCSHLNNKKHFVGVTKVNFKRLVSFNYINNYFLVMKNCYVDLSISTYQKNETSAELYRNLVLDLIKKLPENTQIVYTDASKTCNGVGVSIVHKKKTYKLKIPENCDTYTAEAIAIRLAIGLANKLNGSHFMIMSDALSVLSRIQDNYKSDPIIKDILVESKLSTKKIAFGWIPGHCGIPGNEKANKAANEATKLSSITRISSIIDVNKVISLFRN